MDTRGRAEGIHERSWEQLARLSPHLFFFASVILLAAALHRGTALFFDVVSTNDWVAVVKLCGRVAALLGIGGLSLRISQYEPRLGVLTRTVAAAAVGFTLVLIALVSADNLGLALGLVSVVGFVTFVFSVGTYLLSGFAIVRTGAYPVFIGGILLAAATSLLIVFFGVLVLPIEWIGLLVEVVLFFLYFGLGYSLRSGELLSPQREPASDMTS